MKYISRVITIFSALCAIVSFCAVQVIINTPYAAAAPEQNQETETSIQPSESISKPTVEKSVKSNKGKVATPILGEKIDPKAPRSQVRTLKKRSEPSTPTSNVETNSLSDSSSRVDTTQLPELSVCEIPSSKCSTPEETLSSNSISSTPSDTDTLSEFVRTSEPQNSDVFSSSDIFSSSNTGIFDNSDTFTRENTLSTNSTSDKWSTGAKIEVAGGLGFIGILGGGFALWRHNHVGNNVPNGNVHQEQLEPEALEQPQDDQPEDINDDKSEDSKTGNPSSKSSGFALDLNPRPRSFSNQVLPFSQALNMRRGSMGVVERVFVPAQPAPPQARAPQAPQAPQAPPQVPQTQSKPEVLPQPQVQSQAQTPPVKKKGTGKKSKSVARTPLRDLNKKEPMGRRSGRPDEANRRVIGDSYWDK